VLLLPSSSSSSSSDSLTITDSGRIFQLSIFEKDRNFRLTFREFDGKFLSDR